MGRLTAHRSERRGWVIQVTDSEKTVLTVLVPAELPPGLEWRVGVRLGPKTLTISPVPHSTVMRARL